MVGSTRLACLALWTMRAASSTQRLVFYRVHGIREVEHREPIREGKTPEVILIIAKDGIELRGAITFSFLQRLD